MATYEAKTKPGFGLVGEFLAAIPSDVRREDAHTLSKIYQEITGHEPVMWGPSIIGFDSYDYEYSSGHRGTAAAAGFSPRAANLTLYFADGFESYAQQLAALGPHKLGKSCLYLKRLTDVDLEVLRELLANSYQAVSQNMPR